jgi:hypothetical protein
MYFHLKLTGRKVHYLIPNGPDMGLTGSPINLNYLNLPTVTDHITSNVFWPNCSPVLTWPGCKYQFLGCIMAWTWDQEAVFYSPPRVSMESSWSPQVLMESSWSPPGVLVESSWSLHGLLIESMRTPWGLHEDSPWTLWGLSMETHGGLENTGNLPYSVIVDTISSLVYCSPYD